MDRKTLKRYRKNKKEIELLAENITDLYDRLDEVPVILGKVQASSHNFPYIEQHVSVKMNDPEESNRIKKKIQVKEKRLKLLQGEADAVDEYIEDMPEGIKKEIFEAVYLRGESQEKTAATIGYTQARVSQILKDL